MEVITSTFDDTDTSSGISSNVKSFDKASKTWVWRREVGHKGHVNWVT